MLLKITCRGENTPDIGYLIGKKPGRNQYFPLNFGTAYVFYPKVSAEETTVCLLLDMDPLELVRGKADRQKSGLFAYVNDRPYTSNSYLCTAMQRVFGKAMAGPCAAKEGLENKEFDLEVEITSLKLPKDRKILLSFFEPLGYRVSYSEAELDEAFPEWGS